MQGDTAKNHGRRGKVRSANLTSFSWFIYYQNLDHNFTVTGMGVRAGIQLQLGVNLREFITLCGVLGQPGLGGGAGV